MTAAGTFVAVVGPSGAGKDTLIDAALAHRPDIRGARRSITRPPAPGTEAFDSISDAGFDAAVAEGAFVLHWEAHGLRYGIPSAAQDTLRGGAHVLANLSRGAVDAARARFDRMRVIVVTASSEVLAQRLAERGREKAEQIKARLERAAYPAPTGADVVHIDNSGALCDGVHAFLRALPAPTGPSLAVKGVSRSADIVE